MQRNREEGNETLRLRLDRYEERSGERLQAVAVEMNGQAIAGHVNENETVEVTGSWAGGSLLATEILDLTTGATVRPLGLRESVSRRHGTGAARWILITLGVVGVIVVAVFATIVVSLVRNAGGKQVRLPDVVGELAGKAQFDLVNAGLTSPHITIQGNQFCTVVRQEPPAGTTVSSDRTVTLVAAPTGRNDPPGCR